MFIINFVALDFYILMTLLYYVRTFYVVSECVYEVTI